MTAFSIVAIIGGNLVLGVVVAKFHGGGTLLGVHFANGFEPQALAIGALVVVLLLSVDRVHARAAARRGRPAAPAVSRRGGRVVPQPGVPAARDPALGVPDRRQHPVTAVPYLGRAVLHASEAEASYGTAAVYLSAGVSLPVLGRVVARFGKKRVYSAALLAMGVALRGRPAGRAVAASDRDLSRL